jgi:hypothetical protein
LPAWILVGESILRKVFVMKEKIETGACSCDDGDAVKRMCEDGWMKSRWLPGKQRKRNGIRAGFMYPTLQTSLGTFR